MSARDPLTPEQRSALAELLGDAKPARTDLLHGLGEAVRDCREHEHPRTAEDLFCGNLRGWLGERMAPVLRRLLDAEAELGRVKSDRAEVLAEVKGEVVAWLGKKAREYRSTGSAQHALQADTIGLMASKIDRGAVRLFLDEGGKVTRKGEITQPAANDAGGGTDA